MDVAAEFPTQLDAYTDKVAFANEAFTFTVTVVVPCPDVMLIPVPPLRLQV